MTIAPFQPVGDRARWQMVSDLLEGTETDDVVTYDEAARLLELDPLKERPIIQQAIRTAADHHQKETGRSIEAVPNMGYRIVKTDENLRLAHGRQQRSKRQLKRAHQILVRTDRNGLTPEQRQQFEAAGNAIGQLVDFVRRLDIRQQRLDEVVSHVSVKTDRNEAEVIELRQRLERLERKQSKSNGSDTA